MKRLRPAQDRRQRLDRHSNHVVQRLLGLEGYTAGLGVEAKPGGLIAGLKALANQPGPEAARGAELGRLLEEIVVAGEEKGQSGPEAVDRQAGLHRHPYV